MITRDDFLKPFFAFKGNTTKMITIEMEANIIKILPKINKFAEFYKGELKINSGLRSFAQNKAYGGALKSTHLLGLAVDFCDLDGKIDQFCTDNLNILAECGLYLEHPKWTKNWCHLQIVPPKSGNRIFIPQASDPSPEKFDKRFVNLSI